MKCLWQQMICFNQQLGLDWHFQLSVFAECLKISSQEIPGGFRPNSEAQALILKSTALTCVTSDGYTDQPTLRPAVQLVTCTVYSYQPWYNYLHTGNLQNHRKVRGHGRHKIDANWPCRVLLVRLIDHLLLITPTQKFITGCLLYILPSDVWSLARSG